MSTPEKGFIARDWDRSLVWFERPPVWEESTQEWLQDGDSEYEYLDESLHPEVKPGECIQINSDTNSDNYSDKLTEAKSLLRSAIDALTRAFTFEDVPLSQHRHEMENGRWDGVRGIVEQGEQFLEGYTGELERLRAERDRYREMLERIDRLIPAYPTTAEYKIGRVTRAALNDTEEER